MKYDKIPANDNMEVNRPDNEVEAVVRQRKDKILTGKPMKKKRGLIRRLSDGMMGPGGIRKIGAYVMGEIVVPSMKNLIADSLKSSVDMAFFGEVRANKTVSRNHEYNRDTPKKDYHNVSRDDRYPAVKKPVKSRRYVEEFLIESRAEAAEILATLVEAADMYDHVSVADYYDMLGVDSDFVDNDYGWTIDTIIKAAVIPTREGHIIRFPPLEVL